MAETPRYLPEVPLPPYSYVPGLTPHPTGDPRGHSFGLHVALPAPLTPNNCGTHATYLQGLDLFNHGFYWEAHEAWEALWHAAGRHGPAANFLKGLIKLAAAGVKLREGRPAGVRQHAARGAELLRSSAISGQVSFGIEPNELADSAAAWASEASLPTTADANRSLAITLRLSG